MLNNTDPGHGWWLQGMGFRRRPSTWGYGLSPHGGGGYSEGWGYFAVFLGVLALALSIIALVPLVAAVVLHAGLRRWLARRDWFIVLLGGIVGISWHLPEHAVGYGLWLLSFINIGKGHVGDVPVTTLICMSGILAGLAGVIAPGGTQVPGIRKLWRSTRLVQASITPRPRRRQQLRRQITKNPPLREIPAVRGPYATDRARRTALFDKSIPLGLGEGGKPVWLSTQELGMHGCVVGSTGSGKTVTLMWIIGAALDMGYDVTVLDMKEDTEPGGLRDFVRAYAVLHRVALQEIALGDERPDFWFNALAGMTADEAFDTIISMVEFDDAYWQALNRKVLQQVVQLCYRAAELAPREFGAPTLLEIGKIMESGRAMKDAVKDRVLAIDRAEGVGHCRNRYANVLVPSEDEVRSAASFGTRLTSLYDSSAGRRILVPGGDRKMIDVRRSGLTYVGLNSLGQPDMAKILSSAALQRLSVYAAQRIQGRAGKERPRLIVVDEASFIDRTIAMNMLSRVRAALFSMILCTQGPTDWIDARVDDWSRLTQNINWLIAMSQSSPESAEKCAEFLGMRENKKVSQQVMGGRTMPMGLVQTAEEFIVSTKELRALATGEGYLRVNKPDSRVNYLCMAQRTHELEWYENGIA